MEKYNGNPNVIIVDPEIHHVNISDESHDFILLACDGVYDRMSTEQTCQEVWQSQLQLLVQQDSSTSNTPQGKKHKNFENKRIFNHSNVL